MVGSLAGFQAMVPLLVITAAALVVLVVEMFGERRSHTGIAWLSIAGLAIFAGSACRAYHAQNTPDVYAGAIALDAFAVYVAVLVSVVAIITVLMAIDHMPTTSARGGECYPLLLFSVVGIAVMAAATDLIVMFLGLETMSMAVYVLAGISKGERRSNEAALKYFVMGAFASAFMLYGIAMVYAGSGSTSLAAIAHGLAGDGSSTLVMLGVALLVVGFGFKVSAVPFHLWTPDVYEGAPTSVTVFMATAVKLGGFAAALRVLSVAMAPVMTQLQPLLWVVAALTMTVGNVVALRQSSLKRMLAYSSIAHSGYLLVGLTAGGEGAASAVLFYLAAYAVMNLGAFGIMMMLGANGKRGEDISDLAGLAASRPLLAAAMTICMLSLTGIPPFSGFIGKFYLFAAALEAGQVVLVVIAVLNSVVSAAYYLGVIRTMYFEEGRQFEPLPRRRHLAAATALAVVATVALGLAPGRVLDAAVGALDNIVLEAPVSR